MNASNWPSVEPSLGRFSLDLDTGCLECDARAAQIHGHNEPPKTIKEGRRFVHPDDRVRIDTAFAEAQRSGGVWNAEYRVMPPSSHPHAGEVRWVAFEGSIVRSNEEAPLRLLGVTRDITEHKRAEQRLHIAGRDGTARACPDFCRRSTCARLG